MSKLFPLRSTPDVEEREPKLLELDDDRTDEVFDALGSETARQILLELHEAPRPASELADAVDTTIQNVQYHLTKLEAAELVRVVDTWYAENGAEMDVYAPTDEALVLFAGREPERSLRRLLKRLVGALAPVLVGATVVGLWLQRGGGFDLSLGSGGSGGVDGDGFQSGGDAGGGDAGGGGAGGDGAGGAATPDPDRAVGQAPPERRSSVGGDDGAGGDGGDGAATPEVTDGTPESRFDGDAPVTDGTDYTGELNLTDGTAENETLDVIPTDEVPVDGPSPGAGATPTDVSSPGAGATPTDAPTATDPVPTDVPTVTETAADAVGAVGSDPWLTAGVFLAGGLVALGGLVVVDRMIGG